MQIGILEPKNFSEKTLLKLKGLGEVYLFDGHNLDAFIVDKEVLFICLAYQIDKDFLGKCKKLKFLCTPTTGLTHLDLNEIKTRKIEVISLKGETSFLQEIRATPEHALGLVLALLRNYKSAFLNRNNVEWNRDKYFGFEVFRNKVGLIGYGRVGKILTKYFSQMDAEVYTFDPYVEVDNVIQCSSINELITKTNIIILCASFVNGQDHIINREHIDKMKNKYFINISRGELVDEEYLLHKIQESWFKGVAIDVVKNEQANKNNIERFIELTHERNFLLTPHIAGATFSSLHRVQKFVVEKLYLLCKAQQG